MRYRLRTLLIVLALGPPLLAVGYWGWWRYCKWKENRELERGMWTSDLDLPAGISSGRPPATDNPP